MEESGPQGRPKTQRGTKGRPDQISTLGRHQGSQQPEQFEQLQVSTCSQSPYMATWTGGGYPAGHKLWAKGAKTIPGYFVLALQSTCLIGTTFLMVPANEMEAQHLKGPHIWRHSQALICRPMILKVSRMDFLGISSALPESVTKKEPVHPVRVTGSSPLPRFLLL